MPIDTTRATFVQNEFRVDDTQKDTTVKSKFPNAQIVELDTQLDAAKAAVLAASYLNETKNPATTLTFRIVGRVTLADWVSAVNRYTVTSATFGVSAKTLKLATVKTDHRSNTTIVTVRG